MSFGRLGLGHGLGNRPAGGDGPSNFMRAREAGADVLAAAGVVIISGAFGAAESGDDTFAGLGTVGDGIIGSMAAIEAGSDVGSAVGAVVVAGALSAAETGGDTFAATGSVGATGAMTWDDEAMTWDAEAMTWAA